jgi:hypothetical protein
LTMSRNYQTQLQSCTQEAGPSSHPLLNTLIQNFTQYNYEEPQEHLTPVFQSFTTNCDELLSSTPLAMHHNCGAPLGGSPVNIDEATLDGNDAPSNPQPTPCTAKGPLALPAALLAVLLMMMAMMMIFLTTQRTESCCSS